MALALVSLLAAKSRQTAPEILPQPPTVIQLPGQFLEQENQASRMFHRRQEQEFDLYLILLQESALQKSDRIEVSIDRLAEEAGLFRRMNRSIYTRLVENSLRILQEEYRLIEVGAGLHRSSEHFNLSKKGVRVLQIKNSDDKEYPLPTIYNSFRWARQLSFTAKWTLLVALALQQESTGGIGWLAHLPMTQRRFHLAPETFERGIVELRKYNLLGAHYSVDPSQPSELQQRWFLRSFYNPQEVEQSIKQLEEEYGLEKVRLVRGYAHAVYAEYYPQQIAEMVLLYNRYGDYAFRKAMAIVAEESYDSPKRSLEYATTLMQGGGKISP